MFLFLAKLSVLTCLAQPLDSLPPAPVLPPPKESQENAIWYNPRRHMPLLRTCMDADSYPERKACTDKRIIEILYEELSWNKLKACSIVGTAVISFYVETNGSLTDFRIARDPGAGTGQEALRVVKIMAEQTAPWVPATWGPEDQPVRVQFNVPVKFKLE